MDSSAYYDQHFEDYVQATMALDMGEIYRPFLEHLEAGARILDAGCGPGRDAHAFLQKGFDVEAFDGSLRMVRYAQFCTGLPVRHLRFEDMSWQCEFDGIWACASLLHVPKRDEVEIFSRLVRALKVGGVWYLSFKLGQGERVQENRLFNDHTPDTLATSLSLVRGADLLQTWITPDSRPGRQNENWLNCLVTRT